jgi:hypothetical protein
MKVDPDKKTKIRPIRFSKHQDEMLITYAKYLRSRSSKKVSVSWIVHTMMEMGREEFVETYIKR